MRIREPSGVSELALTETTQSSTVYRYPKFLGVPPSPNPPPPPPPSPRAIVATTKGIQEQELIAPGYRTTLKSAFQSTATTLNF